MSLQQRKNFANRPRIDTVKWLTFLTHGVVTFSLCYLLFKPSTTRWRIKTFKLNNKIAFQLKADHPELYSVTLVWLFCSCDLNLERLHWPRYSDAVPSYQNWRFRWNLLNVTAATERSHTDRQTEHITTPHSRVVKTQNQVCRRCVQQRPCDSCLVFTRRRSASERNQTSVNELTSVVMAICRVADWSRENSRITL